MTIKKKMPGKFFYSALDVNFKQDMIHNRFFKIIKGYGYAEQVKFQNGFINNHYTEVENVNTIHLPIRQELFKWYKYNIG